MSNTNNNAKVYLNDQHVLSVETDKDGRYNFNEVLAKIQTAQQQQGTGGKTPLRIVGANK